MSFYKHIIFIVVAFICVNMLIESKNEKEIIGEMFLHAHAIMPTTSLTPGIKLPRFFTG